MNSIKSLKNEFDNITKLRMFEVEVLNKETKETDYIIFDIEIVENSLVAQHEALTELQNQSDKIAFVKADLDDCYSLDENLQNLYDECINAITGSDFFELSE